MSHLAASSSGLFTAILCLQDPSSGGSTLLTANVGDARILLVRDSEVVQLSIDHVPDRLVEHAA